MKKTHTDKKNEATLWSDDAVDRLFNSNNTDEALSHINTIAPQLLYRGQREKLEEWAGKLSKKNLAAPPWLLYWMGMGKLAKDPLEGQGLLEKAFAVFDEKEDISGRTFSAAAIINAIMLQWNDYRRLDPWIAVIEDNFDLTKTGSPSDAEAWPASAMVCGLTLRRPWDPSLASWAILAAEGGKAARDPMVRALAMGHLTEYYMYRGDCTELARTGEQFKECFSAQPVFDLIQLSGRLRKGLFDIAEENVDLISTPERKAGKMSEATNWGPHREAIFINEIIAAFEADKLDKVRDLLSLMEKRDLSGKGVPLAMHAVLKALYCLRQGNLSEARQNAEKGLKAATQTGMECFEPYAQTALAHILRIMGDREGAWDIIRKIEKNIEHRGTTHGLYLLRIAQAAALLDEGDKRTCRKALREAFRIGRDMLGPRLALLWFWMPSEMSRLCTEALSKSVEVPYVNDVIRDHGLAPPPALGCPRSWPWPYRIRTFGGLSIEINGEPLTFTGKVQKRPLALLKALIALGGKDAREDVLEDLLWPDAEGDSAPIAFRTTLSRLRHLLANEDVSRPGGPRRQIPLIEVKDSRVYLNSRNVWLDIWALDSFIKHVDDLQNKGPQGIRAEEVKDLSVSIRRLYGGAFLDGDDSYWVEGPRKQFHERFSRVVEKLVEMLRAVEEKAEAVALYRYAVEKGLSQSHGGLSQGLAGAPLEQEPADEPQKGQKFAVEGERRFLTVLAVTADCSSGLQRPDPEVQHEIMTECFRTLTIEISRHGGMILTFLGDGMLVLFGAPTACEDHARRACDAALSIRQTISDYSSMVKEKWGVNFGAKIGINSGLVFLGSAKNAAHMDYAAVGETTNGAVEIQRTAPLGTILVSESARGMTEDFFEFQSFDTPAGFLENRTETVPLFRLLKAKKITSRIMASQARGLTAFVGRNNEMSLLKNAFKKVRSGHGRVVGVVGDAGVGKSRLLLEFKRTLAKSKCYCWEGQCQSVGANAAYLPILEMLRSSFDIDEDMTEQEIKKQISEKMKIIAPAFTRLPVLYELLSLPVEDGESIEKLEPMVKRQRVFEAIEGYFLAAAGTKPLVLVIEDLHWMDQTSHELVSRLVNAIEDKPILLLIAYRPEFEHTWRSRPYYEEIYLRELGENEMIAIMRSLLPQGEVEITDRNWILKRAGGNPLFLEELINALKNKEYFSDSAEGTLTLQRSARSAMPDTLLGIIGARIDALDEGGKRLLQVASAIGQEFNLSLLGMVAGAAQMDRRLRRLQELELIFRKSTYGEGDYTFKHALVRETAYETLLLKQRKEVHENIALAIEGLYGDRLEDYYEKLAYHYGQSDNHSKAFAYTEMAAVKALKGSALWEAFRLCCKAREILKSNWTGEDCIEKAIRLFSLIASPMISLGFPENSLDMLLEAERIARECNDIKSMTGICSVIGLYYSVKGDTLLGLQYSEDANHIAMKSGDIELIAPTAFDLCSNYATRGDFPRIKQLVPPTLKLLEESGAESETFGRGYNVYSGLSAFLGFAFSYTGEFDKGRDLLSKALQIAMKTGNLYSLGLVEIFYGYSFCHQGNGKDALPHFEQCIRYLEKGQVFVLLGLTTSGIGYAHYFEGELEKALEYSKKGLSVYLEAGITYDLSSPNELTGLIYAEMGQIDAAWEYMEKAARLAKESNEIFYMGLTKIELGGIMFARNPSTYEEARRMVSEGISIMEKLGAKPNCFRGKLELAKIEAVSGNPLCLKYLEEAEAGFREYKMGYWPKKAEMVRKKFSALMTGKTHKK